MAPEPLRRRLDASTFALRAPTLVTTPSTLHTHSCFNVSWWRDENQ